MYARGRLYTVTSTLQPHTHTVCSRLWRRCCKIATVNIDISAPTFRRKYYIFFQVELLKVSLKSSVSTIEITV